MASSLIRRGGWRETPRAPRRPRTAVAGPPPPCSRSPTRPNPSCRTGMGLGARADHRPVPKSGHRHRRGSDPVVSRPAADVAGRHLGDCQNLCPREWIRSRDRRRPDTPESWKLPPLLRLTPTRSGTPSPVRRPPRSHPRPRKSRHGRAGPRRRHPRAPFAAVVRLRAP